METESIAHPSQSSTRSVMMWKLDGLCQRIVATINGLVIADELDLEFQLAWPNDASMRERFGNEYKTPNDTPQDPAEVFSQAFLGLHFIEDSKIQYPADLSPKKFPGKTDPRGRMNIIMNSEKDFEDAANGDAFFSLAPAELTEDLVPDFLSKCQEKTKAIIFSDAIQDIISRIDSISEFSQFTGIHLRGGDVVYGEIRKSFPRRRNLSLTLALADDLCRSAAREGRKILLVGASQPDIRFLCNRHENAICADDLNLPEVPGHIAVIRDAVLLSRCGRVLEAQQSAVVTLASYLGADNIVSAYDLYSRAAETKVLEQAIAIQDPSPSNNLQKAYVHYNLFILNWENKDFAVLDHYLSRCFSLDPENFHYLVLRYLNCLSCSKPKAARRIRREFFKSQPAADDLQKKSISLMRPFIAFRSRFMEDFLTSIHNNPTTPDGPRMKIGNWVQKYYVGHADSDH